MLVFVGAAPARAIEPTGSITPVHDPTIARDGDTWYAFSTGSRLPIRRSADLVHWTDVGVVFPGGLPAWLVS
jgi:arabinan endo-1,5-alpha-L-arabinosidase